MSKSAFYNDQQLAELLWQGRRKLSAMNPAGVFRMNGPGGCQGEAVCHVSKDQISRAGNSKERFTLMSAVKPFLLLRVLDFHGAGEVARWVDEVPSGMPYYSLEQLREDGGKPRNAMINSGAMLLASKLPGNGPVEQQKLFLDWLRDFCPISNLSVDADCLADLLEQDKDATNMALAEELERGGWIGSAAAAYEVYFRLCCLAGSIPDVAWLGYGLATAASSHRDQVLRTMAHCGLYEASSDWYATTALPAKSGVSGVVFGIWPGNACMAASSPWLDHGGNPILPQWILAQAAAQDPPGKGM